MTASGKRTLIAGGTIATESAVVAAEIVIEGGCMSKNPWSPFDGRRARARVVRTLVRGETVYAGGEIVAEPGWGRFLSCHGDYALAPGSR